MEFFIMLICIGLEKLFSGRLILPREALFHYYLQQMNRIIPLNLQRKSYGLFLLILPGMLLASIAYLGSYYYLSKTLSVLVESIILFCCLGPTTIYHAKEMSTPDIFEKAHINLFTPLFYFVLLGPIGVLLFRLIERLSDLGRVNDNEINSDSITEIASSLVGYLSWLPIRFFIGIQALIGKFPDTLRYWLDHLLTDWKYNQTLAIQSALIAIEAPIEGETIEPWQQKDAVKLVDKTILIFLGMVLVYTVFFYMIG